MPLNNDETKELQRNPINREKYVRDKIRYKSQSKAVRIQKPHLDPRHAGSVAAKLEKETVVQTLTKGIEKVLIDLNARRLFKLGQHMDSDDAKLSMEAVKEAGKVVNQYQDRTQGKAKQSVEVHSTKVIISLDMTGSAITAPRDALEGEITD